MARASESAGRMPGGLSACVSRGDFPCRGLAGFCTPDSGGDRMNRHVHELSGCMPSPLAHYLKGLGILRIVSQQVDRHARALWRNDDFLLVTTLSRAELLAFFLERYAPTPMLT